MLKCCIYHRLLKRKYIFLANSLKIVVCIKMLGKLEKIGKYHSWIWTHYKMHLVFIGLGPSITWQTISTTVSDICFSRWIIKCYLLNRFMNIVIMKRKQINFICGSLYLSYFDFYKLDTNFCFERCVVCTFNILFMIFNWFFRMCIKL